MHTCIVCGKPSHGTIEYYDLCEEHYTECLEGVVDQAENISNIKRLLERGRFMKRFPGIVERHEESIRRHARFTPLEIAEEREKARAEALAKIHCNGCGLLVREEDVINRGEVWDTEHCETCRACVAMPETHEAYVRGFNAGLDAMADAVRHTAEKSALRKKV